jgi:cytochrome c oxidase subunit IV
MAGLHALSEGFRLGRAFRCSDGSLIEPLDIVRLLFPNDGFQSVGDNVCFSPRPFSLPPSLAEYLPEGDHFFLPHHLLDSLISLVLMTGLVTVVMVVMKRAWERLDPRFAAITPAHKQWYVVANICKAAAVALITLSFRFWIGVYRSIRLDGFVNLEMKRCAMIYIATDMASLYMVPKLSLSAVLHHVATASLALIISGINLSLKGWSGLLGVAKMSFINGFVSTPTFSVNAYLGLRVVYPRARWGWLASASLCVYLACCVVSWTMHGLWLAQLAWSWELSLYNLLYLLPMSAIFHDDIMLIRWLWRRGFPLEHVAKNKTS